MDACITAAAFGKSLAAARPPLVIDVRRNERFHEAPDFIARRAALRPFARRLAQEDACRAAPSVVVYCVHGHEVSQNAAKALGARYLEGGIEAWREAGGALLGKPVKSATALGDARAAEDRPHRLSLAGAPLRRPGCATSCTCPPPTSCGSPRRILPCPTTSPTSSSRTTASAAASTRSSKVFSLKDPALDALAAIVRGADTGAPRARPAGGRPAGDLARPVAQLPRRPRDARARHGDVRRAVRMVPRSPRRGARLEARGVTVPFREALRVWLKIGCLGFGGPAGQIALMHRVLVDEKKWVEEQRYLHALNFCMLLPGPEAQKLATYVGWLLHGVRGGLAAGILFVLPGALVMLGVSLLYVLGPRRPGGGRRAVRHQGGGAGDRGRSADSHRPARAQDAAADRARRARVRRHLLPRPAVSRSSWRSAGAIGFFTTRQVDGLSAVRTRAAGGRRRIAAARRPAALVGAGRAGACCSSDAAHVLADIGLFFSKLAVVSFGGAYALLAYMAQQAVETYGWMSAPEMVDGLGPRRDAARAAHQGHAVRRLPRRLAQTRSRSRR